MNFNNFTIKSQEVVQKAIDIARAEGNQAIDPLHLLKAVMTEGEAVVKFIFQKLDITPSLVDRQLEAQLSSLPRVSGGEPYLSNEASQVLQKATDIAQKNGDQYVTIEAILLALLQVNSQASRILKDAGFTEKDLKEAIGQLRQGKKATGQEAEQ